MRNSTADIRRMPFPMHGGKFNRRKRNYQWEMILKLLKFTDAGRFVCIRTIVVDTSSMSNKTGKNPCFTDNLQFTNLRKIDGKPIWILNQEILVRTFMEALKNSFNNYMLNTF